VIDPSIEDLVPVMDSRALFPRVRLKSKDDPSERALVGYATILRWCTRGDGRGIKLDSLVISGVRYTSKQAVGRFLRAASAAEDGRADGAVTRPAKQPPNAGAKETPRSHRKAAAR
jgi:hypothetical protein